ncbi:hypothetical protein ACPF30_003497 [Vibrio cholerae]
MNEECPKCGAKFSVTEIGGGGICGACREPIDCPYCHETVREERTTGTFSSTLIKVPNSPLSRYLGISDDDWEEMGAELNANTGNSGDMTYCYWFMVPEDTPEEILHKTGWKAGQMIDDIPLDVVDH